MIEEEYVSFETAKLLKEKGFDVFGDGSYGSEIEIHREYSPFGQIRDCSTSRSSEKGYPAPTQQMAMRWLRERYYCHIHIYFTYKADANLTRDYASYCYDVECAKTQKEYIGNIWYDTYEEACESAIKYCFENLIQGNS